jgi:hypothetical protein
MVLYTGRRAWKQPLTLKAMMEAPEELGAFIPQWSTLFVDLQQTPPERLLGLGEASLLALRALQAVDEPKETLAAALREVAVRLDALPQEAQGSLRKALIYLYQVVRHKRAADEQEDLFSVLDEAVEQHVSERKEAKVTGAQVIFGQGREEGKEEGRKGLLLDQLEAKFGALPAAVAAKVNAMSAQELDRLAMQILTASTLQEMGL